MRKLLSLFATGVVALIMAGCDIIHEEYSICPPIRNLTLHFSNTDDNGTEIFDQSIDKVDIFLFDQSDNLAYRFAADAAELASSRSASLEVDPGTYRVVCWGNAKTNTSISMNIGAALSSGYVYKQSETTTAANGNPIYYAPFNNTVGQTFTVPATGMQDVDVRFRAAHIKLHFRVEDYVMATGATQNPYIEVTDMFPKYDFMMGHLSTPALCYIQQTWGQTRATDVSFADFNTPRFGHNTTTMVHVRATTSSAVLESLDLSAEMIAKDIDPENSVELTIYLVIKFTSSGSGVNVTIEIEKWDGGEVNPDV